MPMILGGYLELQLIVCLTLIVADCVKLSRPRGVSLAKAPLYILSENFTCFDGSATIEFRRINDDYCDCSDGSDEPGTSACPNGTFDCHNTGYRQTSIPSSQVNDGICDCCDGSDEFETGVQCIKNCIELGRRLHEVTHRDYRQQLDGHELYKEYCRQGQEQLKQLQQKFMSLEKEKKDLLSLRSQLEILSVEAEKLEHEAISQHKEKIKQELCSNRLLDVSSEQNTLTSAENVEQTTCDDTVERCVVEYDSSTKVLVAAAERARNVFREVDAKYQSIDGAISEVQKSTLIDFGSSSEYLPIYTKCYNCTVGDYIYTFCPFANVTQLATSGEFTAVLGRWSRWEVTYQLMLYDGGDMCGPGLLRSVKVSVQCGAVDKVVSVSEPSPCLYQLALSSPAACSQLPSAPTTDPLHDER